MKEKEKFNVLVWDINGNKLIPYDVLPYFRNRYRELAKSKRPKTKEQWESFITSTGVSMYWSRCEWEILVSPWPTNEGRVKIDVWAQIKNNFDLIVKLLMSEYGKKDNSGRSMA